MNEATHWMSSQRFRSNGLHWIKWESWPVKCNKHCKWGDASCQHFLSHRLRYLCGSILYVSSDIMNAVFTQGSPELQCLHTYQLWLPFNIAVFFFFLNVRWVNPRNKTLSLLKMKGLTYDFDSFYHILKCDRQANYSANLFIYSSYFKRHHKDFYRIRGVVKHTIFW